MCKKSVYALLVRVTQRTIDYFLDLLTVNLDFVCSFSCAPRTVALVGGLEAMECLAIDGRPLLPTSDSFSKRVF